MSELKRPTPVRLNQSKTFNCKIDGRIKQDPCAVKVSESESQKTGSYQLSGYDPSYQDYTNAMNDRMHFQKVYRNEIHSVDEENGLLFSELTNPRGHHQVFTRPYAGFFCGPGMPSLKNKGLESRLQQGCLTNLRDRPCEPYCGQSMYRFYHLPDYGNPQRVEVIMEPPINQGGWLRGGLPSRDLVRRVDYQRRCANQKNDQIIRHHKK